MPFARHRRFGRRVVRANSIHIRGTPYFSAINSSASQHLQDDPKDGQHAVGADILRVLPANFRIPQHRAFRTARQALIARLFAGTSLLSRDPAVDLHRL